MPHKKILVIDDEADIREIAQVSLESLGGWEVLTASSGQEGLAMAETSHPDAILLDVMMPDMDGPATYERLRAASSTRHVPVILLTAKVQPADQRRFASLGVGGVLSKPFDPLTLHTEVAQVLGWNRANGGVA